MSQESGNNTIFHIADRQEWIEATASGCYRPSSLRSEGFIHCSKRHQVVPTANRFFKGRRGLVLLSIEPSRLDSLVFEPASHPDGSEESPMPDCPQHSAESFPHVYQALDVECVTRVSDFDCDEHGLFALPDAPSS